VLSIFSSRQIWIAPTPHPQASVPPPPLVPGGGAPAHSLAREGLGESQFQRENIHCGTLYTYFVLLTFASSVFSYVSTVFTLVSNVSSFVNTVFTFVSTENRIQLDTPTPLRPVAFEIRVILYTGF
jgi:hypothetical protein